MTAWRPSCGACGAALPGGPGEYTGACPACGKPWDGSEGQGPAQPLAAFGSKGCPECGMRSPPDKDHAAGCTRRPLQVYFRWSREMGSPGNYVDLGTLLVLRGADGRPYLQLQVDDDHYDGVIEETETASLLATLTALSARKGNTPLTACPTCGSDRVCKASAFPGFICRDCGATFRKRKEPTA